MSHIDDKMRTDESEAARRTNLRQLLLQASRRVNEDVVARLNARGYKNLRSTHTTLLSNMDLAGGTVTAVAARANISKQAMGRLASELEAAGYLRSRVDPRDRRAREMTLTETGRKLMLDSLQIMAELERRYAAAMGEEVFAATRAGLASLAARDKSE